MYILVGVTATMKGSVPGQAMGILLLVTLIAAETAPRHFSSGCSHLDDELSQL